LLVKHFGNVATAFEHGEAEFIIFDRRRPAAAVESVGRHGAGITPQKNTEKQGADKQATEERRSTRPRASRKTPMNTESQEGMTVSQTATSAARLPACLKSGDTARTTGLL